MSPPSPSSPPIKTPNAKRYWGEEKNIDSIYSIYLKKICYNFNNDVSATTTKSTTREFNNLNNHHSKKQANKQQVSNNFQKSQKHHKSMHELSASKSHQQSLIQQLSQPAPPSQPFQSLQWETRQIKVLQAATLDHALKFILLINSSSLTPNPNRDNNNQLFGAPKNVDDSSLLEEERNNVAHITHVMFCTYRIYTNPYELMLKLMDYSDICRIEQYRFVMHYWMDNYPEDFDYIVEPPESSNKKDSSSNNNNHAVMNTNNDSNNCTGATSITSFNNSITSYDSSMTTRTAATTDSETSNNKINQTNGKPSMSTIGSGCSSRSGSVNNDKGDSDLNRRLSNLSIKTNDDELKSGIPLVEELLRLCRDDYIRNKATKLIQMQQQASATDNHQHHSHMSDSSSSKSSRRHQSSSNGNKSNSAVLDLDSRYVAQQLTAIDLKNFLNLKPYSLLEGTKSDRHIQSMIKNFNLLSKHVVVTILKSHTPHIVTSHWITIAMNLRKIKNFNSLKAIIAGLTNESIYRLKQVIWSKIDRQNYSNFKSMASIVDDVNNQTVLRQTQLIVEGTAKMSIEDDSFGTIPYLGTFLTDLNMIDARYQTYVPSPKDETSKLKLINFEKCAKQFEILTQVQLLQKNVLASLHAIQRRNHFDEQTTLNRLKLEFNQNHQMLLAAKPAIPQVSKLFENWFYDNSVATMTDKQW